MYNTMAVIETFFAGILTPFRSNVAYHMKGGFGVQDK